MFKVNSYINFLKIILVFACFIFISSNSYCAGSYALKKSGTIRGTILDSVTHNPLQYTTITVIHPKDSSVVTGAVTDNQGNFTIENVPYGNYTVKISFIGYKKMFINKIDINKNNSEIVLGTLALLPSSINTNGVEVTAHKDLVAYQIDKKVVNVNESPAAKGGTALDVLKTVPSVTVDMNDNVTIHGNSNFTLLIDGKPTVLKLEDALKQIPAETIENIEIITNPSAKYDPDGTAGIINIVMKKNISFTGNLSSLTNVTVGNHDQYYGDMMLNYKDKAFSSFAGADFHKATYKNTGNDYTEKYFNDSTAYTQQNEKRNTKTNGFSFQAGADYSIDSMNTISVNGNYGYWNYSPQVNAKTKNWDMPLSYNNYLLELDNQDHGQHYYFISANYESKFAPENNKLNISIYASHDNTEQDKDAYSKLQTDSFYKFIDTLGMHKSNSGGNSTEYQGKVDYENMLFKDFKLELGGKVEYSKHTTDFVFSDFDLANNQWIINKDFTNDDDFYQYTYAVYTTASYNILGFQSMLGLRGEYYKRRFEQKTSNQDFNYDDFTIYPTLHVSKHLSQTQQLQFSYSKRVSKPNDWWLNPFTSYVDANYGRRGNPYLKPEFTDSYELNFTQSIGMSFLSAELYYKQTKDAMSQILKLENDGKIWQLMENSGKERSYGVDLGANVGITTWFRLNAGVSIYNFKIEGSKESQILTQDKNTFNGNFMATVNITNNTTFMYYIYYNGAQVTSYGKQKGMTTHGLSLKQELFNKTLSLTFQVYDLFSTAKWAFDTKGPAFYNEGTFTPQSPRLSLTLSYRFNNYQAKQKDDSVNKDYQSTSPF